MDNETTQPTTQTPEKSRKSIYIAIAILIVIALVAWGLSMIQKPASEVATSPCAIDIRSTIYQHASTSAPLTDLEAARVVFNNYFSVYKTMPDCGKSALSDFKLVSLGTVTPREGGFTVPIVFDLKPLSMTETAWASSSPEAKIDGGWIRGKKGVLSITRVNDLYQLVI